MIELPESEILGKQAKNVLAGKKVAEVHNAIKPGKFTAFYGDPQTYKKLLYDKKIITARGCGAFVDLLFTDDIALSICDGIIMEYKKDASDIPPDYQLWLKFADGTSLVFTLKMYGCIYVYHHTLRDSRYQATIESLSPLNEDFTEKYIKQLIKKGGKEIPIISFLTVGKNIHGIGNGIVHDILFNARINPKRFISKLSDSEIDNLYHSLKNTLTEMILYNGRETELDLLGNSGQYKTIMAENSCNLPCPICGNDKHKEWFMGNKIYYCPTCQK